MSMSKQKTIADEITELRSMRIPELVARYETTHGKPPRVKHREWLWRRIAWKIQEQRFGGLSTVAKKRLDELIAELDVPLGKKQELRGSLSRTSVPPVGTTLSRTWRGQEIVTTAVDGGWEHEGVVHRSLTAVAKAVTGSHMSGRAFFGIAKRKVAGA